MHSILQALGGYPVAGMLAVLLACPALLAWEYLRLADSSGFSRYLPSVRLAAICLTVLSAILIASRFIFLEHLY
jgi:hypothetical protein